MNENQTPRPEPTVETPETEARDAGKQADVVAEFSALGKRLAALVRSTLESPQRYELEQELREGFQTAVSEVNEAINKARSSDVTKELTEQTGKVVETVRSSKVTQEIREGLLKGLRTLNRELDEVIARAEKAGSGEEAQPAAGDDESTPS
ncbi:MAG: hypothetical protein GXP42_05950 [Chloroflexi bacterium]|nr:hypothetical protein [Chloroflexota bacterium]